MPGFLHQAEGRHRLARSVGAIGQWPQRASAEGGHHLGKDPRGQIRARGHDLIHVDAVIADVLFQGPHAHGGVAIEILLAEFEEPPERRQAGKAALHRGTRKPVQHGIHATPPGQGAHLIGKAKRSAVEDMLHPLGPQERPLHPGTGRRNHPQSEMPGDLDRGKADTACPAMDQDPFPGPQIAQRHQRVPSGEEGHRHRRRRLGRHAFGQARGQIGPHHDMRGKGGRAEGHHRIAHGKTLDTGAAPRDHARTFDADGRPGKAAFKRLFRQKAHRPHHVAVVQARRGHGHFHLARPRFLPRLHLPAQIVQTAHRRRDKHGPHRRRRRHRTLHHTLRDPQHRIPLGLQDDLGFRRLCGNARGDAFPHLLRAEGRAWIHPQQGKGRIFVCGGSDEPPERRLRGVVTCAGSPSPARHDTDQLTVLRGGLRHGIAQHHDPPGQGCDRVLAGGARREGGDHPALPIPHDPIPATRHRIRDQARQSGQGGICFALGGLRGGQDQQIRKAAAIGKGVGLQRAQTQPRRHLHPFLARPPPRHGAIRQMGRREPIRVGPEHQIGEIRRTGFHRDQPPPRCKRSLKHGQQRFGAGGGADHAIGQDQVEPTRRAQRLGIGLDAPHAVLRKGAAVRCAGKDDFGKARAIRPDGGEKRGKQSGRCGGDLGDPDHLARRQGRNHIHDGLHHGLPPPAPEDGPFLEVFDRGTPEDRLGQGQGVRIHARQLRQSGGKMRQNGPLRPKFRPLLAEPSQQRRGICAKPCIGQAPAVANRHDHVGTQRNADQSGGVGACGGCGQNPALGQIAQGNRCQGLRHGLDEEHAIIFGPQVGPPGRLLYGGRVQPACGFRHGNLAEGMLDKADLAHQPDRLEANLLHPGDHAPLAVEQGEIGQHRPAPPPQHAQPAACDLLMRQVQNHARDPHRHEAQPAAFGRGSLQRGDQAVEHGIRTADIEKRRMTGRQFMRVFAQQDLYLARRDHARPLGQRETRPVFQPDAPRRDIDPLAQQIARIGGRIRCRRHGPFRLGCPKEPGLRVQAIAAVIALGAPADGQPVLIRQGAHLHLGQRLPRQHERRQKIDVAQFQPVRRKDRCRRGQHHFRQHRAGNHHATADAVIGHDGAHMRIHVRIPDARIHPFLAAEEWMLHRAVTQTVQDARRAVDAHLHPVPRVGGQIFPHPARRRQNPVAIQPQAFDHGPRDDAIHGVDPDPAIAAIQRRQDRGAVRGKTSRHVALQHGRWPDLDKGLQTHVAQRRHRRDKGHRAADILAPVAAVQGLSLGSQPGHR